MSKSVVVVDYGIGNLLSVKRAFEAIDVTVKLCTDPSEISEADRLVLPGVGAFGAGIAEMQKRGLFDAVKEYAKIGRPLLGICLGTQMMMDSSDENPGVPGLSLIPGNTARIPMRGRDGVTLRIPIIGWYPVQWGNTPAVPNDYFYFVHSYHAETKVKNHIAGIFDYGGHPITAAVRKDHILGYQFHPEKSGENGLNLLREFMHL